MILVLACIKTLVHAATVNTQNILDVRPLTFLQVEDENESGLVLDTDRDNAVYSGLENTKRQPGPKQDGHKRRRHTTDHRRRNRPLNKSSGNKKNRKGSLLTTLGLRRQACKTKTSYVFKTEAEDIYGDIVQVHPVIHVGNLDIDQYFYESYCAKENCKCAGTNGRKFTSSCETTHSYTFARVIKNGEPGWTYIKVRSGCSCVLRENPAPEVTNVLDLLK